MAENLHHDTYLKKTGLFVLFANLFIWIGYAIEIMQYAHIYSLLNMIIHIICIVIFSGTLIFFIKNKSQYYKLVYLTITYTVLINMIISQIFFQSFFEQTGYGRFHFFSRNVFFAISFIPVLGILNRKSHIISQGTLILWMITFELISSNDKFLIANASLYYITFISFCWIMYLMSDNIDRYVKEINQSNIKINNLLLNILPADVAEELKDKGAAQAKLFDNVTVLFTDFVGFTQVSEKLSPKELVAEIHTYYTAFDKIMEKHGLEKIKTIGDSYLAICGLPLSNENHAKQAVLASIDILEFMNHHEMEGGKFNIRIGINSGSVVAGIVGVRKFAYDIWGDTVNTASRMESNGAVGKINISETTYKLVKDHFNCSYRGKVKAKNKGEIDMYFVELGT
jgi:class 3 adenylate cyclase